MLCCVHAVCVLMCVCMLMCVCVLMSCIQVWVKSQAVSLMQDHAQHCPKPIPRWPELLSHFTTAYKTGSMMCPDYLTDSSMEMEASGFAMPDAEQSDAAWEAYLNRRTWVARHVAS